ncbi:MAG TPA: DUF992 domain-containing protein [Pseudolabrys sp.]|nr:DUF992 domain-containing protein [Pseudolabrys sp.]
MPVFQAVKGCSRRYPLGWAVFSSTVGPAFGGLAGTYVGASGEATLGVCKAGSASTFNSVFRGLSSSRCPEGI